MTLHDHQRTPRSAVRMAPVGGGDPVPDRRGETMAILATIFVRPTLDVCHSVACFARHLRRHGDVLDPMLMERGVWQTVENQH